MRDQRQTRINRVGRRASPAVQEAYREGRISLRKADILLHSDPLEAEGELTAILEKQAEIARRSQVATRVIRSHLQAGRRGLRVLETDLRVALNTGRTVF